jgi:DNA polymerase-3 subunit epsilon
MNDPAAAGRSYAAGDEKMRVLHRLDVREGPTGEGDDTDTRIGIVVDVETTSTIMHLGAVIELAVRRFRFDRQGVITHIDRGHEWLEDPGTPLTHETTAITGLTDADLVGREIDEHEAAHLLRSASLVIAHHAAFDRPYVERRLVKARGLPWACSFRQIDWRSRKFDGRTLGYLLQQTGFFFERGHRAGMDVDALVQLLRHRFPDGTTALAELIERSPMPSWVVRAVGAGFVAKDALKERGYRWDPERRLWWTEVEDDVRTAEEFWLAANVYAAGLDARSMGPDFEKVTAAERFL